MGPWTGPTYNTRLPNEQISGYTVDYESPHRDGDADMFNFRNALMMVLSRPLCGRVDTIGGP